jgi:hypothetical protein
MESYEKLHVKRFALGRRIAADLDGVPVHSVPPSGIDLNTPEVWTGGNGSHGGKVQALELSA